MHYGMLIDLKKCAGCHNCAVTCKNANNLPEGLWYNTVRTEGGAYDDTPAGTYPNLSMEFVPVGCQHCANPACVAVCPTGATAQREDGIVTVDSETCIGCGSCISACPYDVRTLLEGEPSFYFDFALGDWDAPAHKAHTVEKCTFCANRIDRGEQPACMELCPVRARLWGDLDDTSSEISQAIASAGSRAFRLQESEGTAPSVYYLR